MFYSFVLKLKLVDLETNSNLIKKFQNIGLLREILGKVKGSTISSFLTKDKEFNQGRIYFIRITSIDSKEIKEITKYLYEKKIFNEKITIQNQIFLIEDIIHNEENSRFSKQMLLQDFLDLKELKSIKIKFITPTVFKFGEMEYFIPEPYLYFGGALKRFNLYFDESEIENPLKNISSQVFKKINIVHNSTQKRVVTIDGKFQETFIGEVIYDIPKNELDLGKIVDCLSRFSFFSGVGQFTERGLGQVLIES